MSTLCPRLLHVKGDTRFKFIVMQEPVEVWSVVATTRTGRETRTIRLQDSRLLNGEKLHKSGLVLPVRLVKEIAFSEATDARVDLFIVDSKVGRDMVKAAREFASDRTLAGRKLSAVWDFHPAAGQYINVESCSPARSDLGPQVDPIQLIEMLHERQGILSPYEEYCATLERLCEEGRDEEAESAFWHREVGYDIRNRFRIR